MTTLTTPNGRTLTSNFRRVQRHALWLKKLTDNCRKKLNRLGGIVALNPVSLKPASTGNRISLFISGKVVDKKRIAKVLGVDPKDVKDGNTVNVQFSRIKVDVKFVKSPAKLRETESRKAA